MKITKNVCITLTLASVGIVAITSNAEAQTGCSAQDQQILQSYLEAVAQAAYSGNMQYVIQLGQQLQSALSSDCLSALAQFQQQGGYGSYGYGGYGNYGGYAPGSPSIYDHGGGTYSVPGGVTCGPSGCY